MTNPDTTKNTSTPTNPPGSASPVWHTTTRTMARARRPWMSARCPGRASIASSSTGTPTLVAHLTAAGGDGGRDEEAQPLLPRRPGGRWPRRRASFTHRWAVVAGTSLASAMSMMGRVLVAASAR